MSARQLIVLVIAAVAAIGALLLIRGMSNAPPAEAEAARPINGEEVLVAARDIAQGAALTPGDLAVALFPSDSVSDNFIKAGGSAQADQVGAVTRRAFVRGEPLTTTSVIQPEGRGFMAAQLEPGYRAVAVEIEDITAVAGYIQPNDRVDVITTVKSDGPSGEDIVQSTIVLEDVRVLAVGDKTQGQSTGSEPETIHSNVAVLELSAEESRILAQANEAGDINLALRGVQTDTAEARSADRANQLGQQSGAVRVHAFGAVSGGRR